MVFGGGMMSVKPKEHGLSGLFNRMSGKLGLWCLGSAGVTTAAFLLCGTLTPWLMIPLVIAGAYSTAVSGQLYASSKMTAGASRVATAFAPAAKEIGQYVPNPVTQIVTRVAPGVLDQLNAAADKLGGIKPEPSDEKPTASAPEKINRPTPNGI
jgi:hypothetical protein